MGALDVYDKAQALLTYLYGQLECTLNGRPCSTLVALCEPVIPCCDYLAVFVDEIPGSPLVSGCESLTDEVFVRFGVKLVRPCNVKSPCSPTLEDVNTVKALFVDRIVLRSAIERFMTADSDCFVQYEIFPVTSDCSEYEMCSVISTGVLISMPVCDDGGCDVPFVGAPDRCECDPGFVDVSGVDVSKPLQYD